MNTNKSLHMHIGSVKRVQNYEMSCIMRKLEFCLGKNKDADQLCSNCTADQRLCFRYNDSTIPLLLKSKISSFQPSSVAAKAGLFQAWVRNTEDQFSSVAAQMCKGVFNITKSAHYPLFHINYNGLHIQIYTMGHGFIMAYWHVSSMD